MVEVLEPFSEAETERLRLRKVTLEDLDDIYAVTSDPEVARYMSWAAHTSRAQAAEIVEKALRCYETGGDYRWAVALKGDDRLIGLLHVKPEPRHGRVNVGYWLGRPHWGSGYMTEALRGLIGICFEKMGANRVEAEHYAENTASGRVMQKAGMAYEGTLRQYMLCNDGRYHDCRRYSLTRDKYVQTPQDARRGNDG